MTIINTHHFVSLDSAINYYSNYGFNREDVLEKWKKLEIEIGKPLGKEVVLGKDGRYSIVER